MSSSILFPTLPDAARVWVHPATASLSTETQTALLNRLNGFIDQWSSHEQNVCGAADILYDRFVVLAGIRSDQADPSGCAIDDATRAIDSAAEALSIAWVPSLQVLYRSQDGSICAVSRSTFQDRVDEGLITANTTVFDPSVTTLAEVRSGSFEQPAGKSWHARAFSLAEPA